MLRGRSISPVLGAAIFIACRELEVPRTLDDLPVAFSKDTRSTNGNPAEEIRLSVAGIISVVISPMYPLLQQPHLFPTNP